MEYQSREIEAHYDSLKGSPFSNSKKFNLWLNKWSNNFGRDWIRGIIFSVLTGLIFFYFLVISTDQYKIGFAFDWNFDLVLSFLKFMNPLRFFELENIFKTSEQGPAIKLSWDSYLWDFLGRVFVAYGFYQTIQAFRRFGRK